MGNRGTVLVDSSLRTLGVQLDEDGVTHGSRIGDGVFRLCTRLNYRWIFFIYSFSFYSL
jgi:hypothetical protein